MPKKLTPKQISRLRGRLKKGRRQAALALRYEKQRQQAELAYQIQLAHQAHDLGE